MLIRVADQLVEYIQMWPPRYLYSVHSLLDKLLLVHGANMVLILDGHKKF